MDITTISLKHKLHKRYLLRFLDILPSQLSTCDGTRITIAYFAISGLDVLNSLDAISEEKKQNIIEWIYSLQVVDHKELISGFQGSSTLNTVYNKETNSVYKWSHIAGTYTALCSLVILGDDLGRVNRKAISESLKILQLPNGCYTAAKEGTESDMRFLYCAASICYFINDWSGMNVDLAVSFIINSISYDNGIAQAPELEAHGGSTYCAIASLVLMNRLNSLSKAQVSGLQKWLFNRQIDGFNGRPNKPVDTCYAYWVGGALKLLGSYDLVNFEKLYTYVLATQDQVIGGFSKWVDSTSDPMHTYLGLAGLSFMKNGDLNEVMSSLNITQRAYEHLKNIHEKWCN